MNRLVFAFLVLCVGLAAFSLVTFFGHRTGPALTFQVRSDPDTLLFSVTPWGEARQTKDAYAPLLKYLGSKIGKKIQILVIEDYATAIDNVVEGNIDIAVLPPVSYVMAKQREPKLQYISTLQREQGGSRFATYRGYLVALKSKFAGWDLSLFLSTPKKYRFGFVTRQSSSSGFAYPTALLRRHQIDPEQFFKEVRYYDNHSDLTDAMAAGQIDLGATWEYNLEEAQRKFGDIFQIVEVTGEIPGLAWVAAAKVPAALVQQLRELQQEITLDEVLRQTLLTATPDKGWEVVTESFYDEVREVLKYVETFQ